MAFGDRPVTRRQNAARASAAPRTVVVTQAQLEFLVEGDLTRLAAIRGLSVRRGTTDAYTMTAADLELLVAAWAAVFGDDRRPGIDCEIPAWTPALAALAARRHEAAEVLGQRMLALTDYLVFGRASPLRRLVAAVAGAGDEPEGQHGYLAPPPDPEVTRLTADLQQAGVVHDDADAAYRGAVQHAIADASPLTLPSAQGPTATSEHG